MPKISPQGEFPFLVKILRICPFLSLCSGLAQVSGPCVSGMDPDCCHPWKGPSCPPGGRSRIVTNRNWVHPWLPLCPYPASSPLPPRPHSLTSRVHPCLSIFPSVTSRSGTKDTHVGFPPYARPFRSALTVLRMTFLRSRPGCSLLCVKPFSIGPFKSRIRSHLFRGAYEAFRISSYSPLIVIPPRLPTPRTPFHQFCKSLVAPRTLSLKKKFTYF